MFATSWLNPLRKLPVIVVAVLLLLPALPVAADEGSATWYGQPFHGRRMYNGQVFDMYDPTTTAANIFPIGTWLKVTNPANGRTVVVQVRDRGAFKHALDLSYAAFQKLDDPAKMWIAIRYERISGPDAASEAADKTPQPAAAAPVEAKPAKEKEKEKAPPQAQPAPAAPPEQYQVGRGDTLISIARRFGLSTEAIAQWNGLPDPNRLQQGQVLRLQAPRQPASRGEAHAAPASKPGKTYLVVEGDTLWDIAERFDTSPHELAALNGVDDPSLLAVGQTLLLPQDAQGGATAIGASYVVRAGDTLIVIADVCGTTVDALVEVNDLSNANLIQIGQELSCS